MFKEERLELLLAKSAEVNKTCVKRMLEKGRKRFNVEARNMVYTILRRNDWSYQKIADNFGKNHSSILHGVSTHERGYKTLNYYQKSFDRLEMLISEDVDLKLFKKEEINKKIENRIEKLESENARLRDQIFDIKLKSQTLTNLLKSLCS